VNSRNAGTGTAAGAANFQCNVKALHQVHWGKTPEEKIVSSTYSKHISVMLDYVNDHGIGLFL
jgi:hypothetical protein